MPLMWAVRSKATGRINPNTFRLTRRAARGLVYNSKRVEVVRVQVEVIQ